MTVNWYEAIDILVKDWEKLTRGKKPLEIVIAIRWGSGRELEYSACLYCPGHWNMQYFNTIQDAQKWVAEQLANILEEEFRQQVALQEKEEAKEAE